MSYMEPPLARTQRPRPMARWSTTSRSTRRVCLTAALDRASVAMTGTSGSTSSASRTSSRSWARCPENWFTATTKGRPRLSKKSSAGNESSIRRLSTSTIAPSAPAVSSFHMKPKRSWPGVPKMYRRSDSSTVIRPKSMATVVVVFVRTSPALSTPAPRVVMAASVVSGGISEMAPTRVVLPTPKPPATMILTGTGAGVDTGGSECVDSIDQPHDQRRVVGGVDGGLARLQVTLGGEVTGEHRGDAEGELEQCGDLDDRLRGSAEVRDVPVLERQLVEPRRSAGGEHVHRLEPGQVVVDA